MTIDLVGKEIVMIITQTRTGSERDNGNHPQRIPLPRKIPKDTSMLLHVITIAGHDPVIYTINWHKKERNECLYAVSGYTLYI